ncbi:MULTISPECIES: glycosyltransferase [Halolamina]|uniref:Glycosyltransferase, GT2 family n=1 Tax=Halolamina pelagica TaxID=699431 RepID=A0A1I5V0C4_9EURY|nr:MULTISPECIES: glycosyltransferase [Halolamina]NHX36800.1 glycosyltransferase [Halolamina sp. R1-12]SFQ00862.1 Glycosyltransferase, GT2 family [Halolamina pelagica]
MTSVDSSGFSVVLPVLNEAENIEGCLDSLLRASLSDVDLEILVVDGMSDDGTREIIDQYSRKDSSIQLVDNEQQTTPTGFNKGFETASNGVIILMSGHAQVTPNFFDHIRELFEERAPDADIVGSRVDPVADGYVQTSIAGALMSRFGAGSKRFQAYEGYVDTVSYGAYKRYVIESVGKMDPDLPRGQDYEYNKRAREHGFTIYQSAQSTVQYEPRSTFIGLFKQKFGNGRGKTRIHQQSKSQSYRGLGLHTAALVLFSLIFILPGATLALSILPPLYVLGIVFTATKVIQRNNEFSRKHIFGIVIALTIIHSGFVSGFVTGLLTPR